VRFAVRERSPSFTPAACVELFAALAGRAAELTKGDQPPVGAEGFGQVLAVAAMLRCSGPLPPGLAAPATILARQPAQDSRRHLRLALAAVAGPAIDAEVASEVRAGLVGDGLAGDELDVVLTLDGTGRAVVAESDRYATVGGVAPLPDVIDRLASLGEYAAFARAALEAADARVADIHAGRTAYEADKAFTVAEGDVLWRACQVALLRDEPWLGELLGRLLPGVVVAPTAAKTAPSQSASIVLAQAVEAWPTPEAVAALREAWRVVRHAGLSKKLDRLLRTADKGLARRPAVALRLPASAPTRAQLGTVVRALEGGYALDVVYPYRWWRTELACHPHLRGLVGRLIWDVETAPGQWHAVLPDTTGDANDPPLTDATGEAAPTLPPEARVRLWHPGRASTTDRTTWRDRVVVGRLTQPFRQAFREHYPVDDAESTATDLFTGHIVAIRPLLGLAIREGWRSDHIDGVLHRELGPWRVALTVSGALHPGATGFGDVGALHLQRRDGGQWRAARFSDASPVVVSEALRGVDLLVSVAGFGLDDDPQLRRDRRRWELLARLADRPLGETARMRRTVLQRILADTVDTETVLFRERHIHVGPYAVHLATARVTRDGEPVIVDQPHGPSAAALPWLPYDEHLLERIARTVVALASDAFQG
jgi:hypothetical protein